MAYVPVPKDLSKVKTKVAFNLTKRQLVCFGSGALIGVPLFFLLRGPAGNSVAAMCMMLVMLPWKRSSATSSRGPSSGPIYTPTSPITSTPRWSGRQISIRRCMTLFAAKTKRQAEKAEPQTKTRRKLTRAERKQIEAAIARANRTDKKEQSAQDSIPYERMWPDGICKVADGRYTKTIQFQDINYQLSQNEDKAAIFEGWCDFLNYFDSSIRFQLSFLNLAASQETFANSITIPPQGDDFDPIRVEYTQMLQNQLARGNNGLIKTKYLTFSIEADSIRTAKPRLERIETDVLNYFTRLGVAAEGLDGKARLAQLHAIFHMDEQVPFQFEWDWLAPSGLSTKAFIAQSGFEFRTGKQFRIGNKYDALSI